MSQKLLASKAMTNDEADAFMDKFDKADHVIGVDQAIIENH